MGCIAHAAQLERESKQIEQAGAKIMALGPGSDGSAERLSKLLGLHFPLYGDRRAAVFGAFGFRRVLAVVQQSGAAVIDRDGVLRYIHRTGNFMDALHLDDIMKTLTPSSARI